MAETTRTQLNSRNGFGVSLILHTIYGVKSSKNLNFWNSNRRIQAKRAKGGRYVQSLLARDFGPMHKIRGHVCAEFKASDLGDKAPCSWRIFIKQI